MSNTFFQRANIFLRGASPSLVTGLNLVVTFFHFLMFCFYYIFSLLTDLLCYGKKYYFIWLVGQDTFSAFSYIRNTYMGSSMDVTRTVFTKAMFA